VAVFVDAGYLFAQGSTALSGSKKARAILTLDAQKAVSELKSVAIERATDCKLLRVYWYDGAIGGARPTTDQAQLANLNDVKLRLGFVNSSGQQKGVDSLIVTDLIELARLGSICDAVVLSGDEDVRVGVHIAQNYGVRVHLLGIIPSRDSQSQQLLQEADTTMEWNAETIASFLSIRDSVGDDVRLISPEISDIASKNTSYSQANIVALVDAVVSEFSSAELDGITAYWKSERGAPSEFDGKILAQCRDVVGRKLDPDETKFMRSTFQRLVRLRLDQADLSSTPRIP
ncbi:MAG: NYN domain-containing protein, partial [Alphaproteobacteria bacterium]|nr:NYN domain-containing protein [Alphaproteobacteria bacterium]